MLKFATHQSHALAVALPAKEDQILRRAFGRFAEQQYRQAGADVVSVHYEKKRHFQCDCRLDAPNPPLLFLVSGTHIRREADGKGTTHDEGCDFARDPADQKRLVRTYRLSSDKHKLSLVRNFSSGKREPSSHVSVSTKRSRPTLARVLCSLLHAAKLDHFFSTTPLNGNRDQQIDDLLKAAESFSLTTDKPLKPWLATSLRDFYRLKERLDQSMVSWKRPHGLFIEVFDRIEGNVLYPKRSDLKPLHVTGRLTVFGEGEHLRRPPYLVIGLVSQPGAQAKKVELLNAYGHPCVAWDRLTLVDSQLERETLALLIACRDELAASHNVTISIEKPLFDIGPDEIDDPRDLCLPDFVLHCHGENVKHPSVVIETMGFDDPAYRIRKQRMRGLFERIGKGPHPVPVLEHDRLKTGVTPRDADIDFCNSVYRVISGALPSALQEDRFRSLSSKLLKLS